MENSVRKNKLFSLVKSLTLVISLLALVSAFLIYQNDHSSSHQPRIVAITQIIQHPSLDQIRQGIIDELAEQGFHEGREITLVYDNAQGNITTASQIAQKFVGLEPAVIVAISTPSAQTVQSAIRGTRIPLVFSGVTDPVAANLVEDLDKPGKYITGNVDVPPIKEQLEILSLIVPEITTLGVIYNPGEINSVRHIEKLQGMANKLDIQVIKSPAVKSSEVYGAATRLADIADVIYLPNDNAVVAALDSIVRVALEKKIPTMASEDQSAGRGILVGLANSQYQVGRDTGKIVVRILKGEKPSLIPVVVTNKPKITFNKETAQALNIDIKNLDQFDED